MPFGNGIHELFLERPVICLARAGRIQIFLHDDIIGIVGFECIHYVTLPDLLIELLIEGGVINFWTHTANDTADQSRWPPESASKWNAPPQFASKTISSSGLRVRVAGGSGEPSIYPITNAAPTSKSSGTFDS